ncbi:fasciclin-like arabinogalactan protein 16 [Macadamia integrifolia]|uniref:fasciclin-like arabinogalactan protein 16 n=1 Tax=Macadamia integrifolia TaxID=60698 RepID=UPI001C4E3B2C|nr:fasciclin-like arabinogalactan protein 16 [Macadamia integrifolia]
MEHPNQKVYPVCNCSCGGSDGDKSAKHKTLFHDHVHLTCMDSDKKVDSAAVIHPNAVTRPDGVINGIERLLFPRSIQDDFNRRRNLQQTSAVKPEGASVVDPITHRLNKTAPPAPAGSPPVLPIYDAMAPGPSLAPAQAPGPGGPHLKFDGESQVKDFIHTLLHYGRYNELADILVNLTSLASEVGKLVSEGYVLIVLAPNDNAMENLTTDQLSEPGAPEQIIYYHFIPEYQTEESMYNAVRRFGKIKYDTLRVPHKVVVEEVDGFVKFGQGDESIYLFDPDIYTDGQISVQGIDGMLFPIEEKTKSRERFRFRKRDPGTATAAADTAVAVAATATDAAAAAVAADVQAALCKSLKEREKKNPTSLSPAGSMGAVASFEPFILTQFINLGREFFGFLDSTSRSLDLLKAIQDGNVDQFWSCSRRHLEN